MKIGYALLLSVLLSACGQTGPLYMPGTATGVHKKDEFVLGNSQSDQQKAASTMQKTTKPAATVAKPATNATPPVANAPVNSDTGTTQSADSSTAPNEDSTPLGEQDPAPPGTVQ